MSQGLQNASYPVTNSSKASLIFAGDNTLADEGSFFTACSPTPGTGIAGTGTLTTDLLAQTNPIMLIQNQNPNGGYNIYMRYVKLTITTIPGAATPFYYSFRLDNLSNKITAAGTVLTAHNANSNSLTSAKAYIAVGTNTCATMSSAGWLVDSDQVESGTPVVQDQYYFNFGAPAAGIDQIGGVTTVKRMSFPVPPIIIAPGWTLTLQMFGASNTGAPSYTFAVGWSERPQGQ